MKLIIDIPDELFNIFKKHGIMAFDYFNEYDKDTIARIIAHGTPLPKGHDRLVEAKAVIKALFARQTIDDVPTIVEADKESDNG